MTLIDRIRGSFANLTLAARVAAAGLALIVGVLGGLAAVVSHQTVRTLDARATAELGKQTDLIVDMMGNYDRSLREAAARLGNSFAGSFAGEFTVDPKRTVRIGEVDSPAIVN